MAAVHSLNVRKYDIYYFVVVRSSLYKKRALQILEILLENTNTHFLKCRLSGWTKALSNPACCFEKENVHRAEHVSCL